MKDRGDYSREKMVERIKMEHFMASPPVDPIPGMEELKRKGSFQKKKTILANSLDFCFLQPIR